MKRVVRHLLGILLLLCAALGAGVSPAKAQIPDDTLSQLEQSILGTWYWHEELDVFGQKIVIDFEATFASDHSAMISDRGAADQVRKFKAPWSIKNGIVVLQDPLSSKYLIEGPKPDSESPVEWNLKINTETSGVASLDFTNSEGKFIRTPGGAVNKGAGKLLGVLYDHGIGLAIGFVFLFGAPKMFGNIKDIIKRDKFRKWARVLGLLMVLCQGSLLIAKLLGVAG